MATPGKLWIQGEPLAAQDLNTLINPAGAAHIPAAVAAGVATVSLVSAALGSVTVPLPVGRFNVAPIVVATVERDGNTYYTARVSQRTAANFALTVSHSNGTAATTDVLVTWVALQMTMAAANG